MAPWLDARIPVVINPDELAAGDAVLVEAGVAVPPGAGVFVAEGPHVVGCGCCAGRYGAALALDRFFLLRARGELAFFRRVAVRTVSPAGEASVRTAIETDPVVSARYRLG